MLIDLTRITGYLHAVFVEQFDYWIALGFIAQLFFTMRFLVQWLASEKAKRSVIPLSFWFFSIGGGFLLLIYAIHRRDPVFIAGQGMGLFIYARNLMLIYNGRRADEKNEI
ncbi:MAG: lipid-A-disaccharide synthase N-terminal domain-containing protein [Pseudomonadota bacterium]